MSATGIEIQDLEFQYRKSDFSMRLAGFSVSDAETVAIIGKSGTGKTTLLNILSGCEVPTAGSVVVAGTDLTRLPDEARRAFRIRDIGMVFQEFELLDHLNVLDNILLPYRISPELRLEQAVVERVRSLAEKVGIADKLKRNTRRLSQGERQRVAVCRALLPEPAILLCDEPTGNLDPENSAVVIDILLNYAAEKQATVLSVTHDHDIARRFDRTVDISEIAGGAA